MASRHVPVVALLLAAAACALANQSPINIISSDATTPTKYTPLSYKHYGSSQNTYYISNTGHGAQITLKNWMYNPKVKGGPLPNYFVLEQAHFHWGATDGKGSEHQLNGKPFSMEVHLVHWNNKYNSFEEASTKADGLAVVGFFIECADCLASMSPDRRRRLFCGPAGQRRRQTWLRRLMCDAGVSTWTRVSTLMSRFLPASINDRIRSRLFPGALADYKNHDFQKLVDEIPRIAAADSKKVESKADLLAWARAELRKGGYFTYPGSLTTEPYSENVRWIVYENPIIIGKSQIEPFRSIENHHGEDLKTNFRALQTNNDLQLQYVPLY